MSNSLQDEIRKVASDMADLARKLRANNPGQLEDVNDVSFQLSRIAVLLFGYAPVNFEIKSAAEYRAALFKEPAPLPVPHYVQQMHTSGASSAGSQACSAAPPLSGSAK